MQAHDVAPREITAPRFRRRAVALVDSQSESTASGALGQPLYLEIVLALERLDFRIAGEKRRATLERGRHREGIGVGDRVLRLQRGRPTHAAASGVFHLDGQRTSHRHAPERFGLVAAPYADQFEMASPNGLLRAGWKRDSMKVGDVVAVEARQARDGSPNANAQTVVLTATGQRLFAGSPVQPAQ